MKRPKRIYPGPALAPYDKDGLMSYASFGPGEMGPRVEWRENNPFADTLVLVGMERGRSAARFIWQNEAGNVRYPMFPMDLLDIAILHGITNARVTGEWIVMKRGANFGIARYEA